MSHAWVIPDKTIYLTFCCVTIFFIFFHLFLWVLLGGRSEGSLLHQLLVYNHGLTFSVFLKKDYQVMKYIFILNLSLCCCCWVFFVVVVFVFFRGWREGVGLNQIKWKKQDRLRAAGAVSMRQTALTFCCFVWQFSLSLYDRHGTGAMSDSFHCCCMTGMWLVRCLTAFIVVVWQTWDWWLVWCLFSLLLYDRCGTGGWCDVCFHCCCMTVSYTHLTLPTRSTV